MSVRSFTRCFSSSTFSPVATTSCQAKPSTRCGMPTSWTPASITGIVKASSDATCTISPTSGCVERRTLKTCTRLFSVPRPFSRNSSENPLMVCLPCATEDARVAAVAVEEGPVANNKGKTMDSLPVYFMKTKVRLQTSSLLNERFKLNTDGLEEKFLRLLTIWKKQEKKIIKGLEKITGLSFLRNYIDIFLINPDNAPSISHPAIVKVDDNENKTIRTIIHELIHSLMWDNKEKVNWSAKIHKLFKNENRKTAIHIAVHAILEAVYTDILKKPDDIIKDIKESQKRSDYKRAWEIVKKEGYKNIIDKLKSSLRFHDKMYYLEN